MAAPHARTVQARARLRAFARPFDRCDLRGRNGRRRHAAATLIALPLAAVGIGACGTQGIQLSKSNPDYSGAVIFRDHCSGCHTLGVVGAEGSAQSVPNRVKTNAPNFDFRKENVQQVLYALRNGGFSGEVMPENVVVGRQAQEVAEFLATYSGQQAPKEPGESSEAAK